jgi:hypothetical protein
MAHDDTFLVPCSQICLGSIDFVCNESEEPLLGAIFVCPEPTIDDYTTTDQDTQPEAPQVVTRTTKSIMDVDGC